MILNDLTIFDDFFFSMCLYPVRNPVLRLEIFGIVTPLIFSTVLYIIPVNGKYTVDQVLEVTLPQTV